MASSTPILYYLACAVSPSFFAEVAWLHDDEIERRCTMQRLTACRLHHRLRSAARLCCCHEI